MRRHYPAHHTSQRHFMSLHVTTCPQTTHSSLSCGIEVREAGPRTCGPFRKGAFREHLHRHQQITDGHVLPGDQVIHLLTHTRVPQSEKRCPGKRSLHPYSCSCTSPTMRPPRLLQSIFVHVIRNPMLEICWAIILNRLTEQPLPLVSLFHKSLREELLQKQGLLSCTVTYAAGVSARMLTWCFNPASHRPLYLLPLLSSKAFSLCVRVLYNFWHLPSRLEAFENLFSCPDHIDCSWPLRT